ncbi:MAG: ATP-binding cassette domain-containing protein [Pseudonocardiaceae bacterium]
MTAPAIPRALRGRRRVTFAVLVAVGAGQAAAAVAWSLVIGSLVDGLTTPGTAGLALRATELVSLALVSASLVAGERVLAEHLGQGWVNEIRVLLFGHVARTPVREHRRSTGATTLRFVGDLTALRRWASLGLAKLAVAVPLVMGCLVALVLVSPVVAMAAGAVIAAGLGATVASTSKLRATSRLARRRRARVAAHITEHVGRRLVMQAFGRADAERRQVRRAGGSLARAMIRRAHAVGLVRGIGEATTLLATAAALLAAVSGGVSPGSAAAAIAVVAILVTPLRDLSRVAEYRAGAVVATEKIAEVLARPVRPQPAQPAQPLPAGPGRLELDRVTLHGVFGPLSATAEPGEVVALVGPNGAGKSTLLTLLAGLEHPDSGRVQLDGADMHATTERDVRRAVGLVTPDLPLLRGTIADNVRYADPDADGWALRDAIHRSGLGELLASLPDGLRTRVGEGGAGLSAGQRQRVALARALLTGPRVLLLDEADAHLDPAAAGIIDQVLAGFAGTIVVVTHRPECRTGIRTTWRLAGGRLQVARLQAADPTGDAQ